VKAALAVAFDEFSDGHSKILTLLIRRVLFFLDQKII
jgi:hypothetical protein